MRDFSLNKLILCGAVMATPFLATPAEAQELRPPYNPNSDTVILIPKKAEEKNAKQIVPRALEKGDTIAIFAPGYNTHGVEASAERWLDETQGIIEGMGYHVKIPPQTAKFHKDSPYAGTAEERTQTLNDLMTDPTIRMIWCVQGGQGASQIDVNKLDIEKFSKSPKVIAFLSDFTSVAMELCAQGIPSLHGPTAAHVRPLPEKRNGTTSQKRKRAEENAQRRFSVNRLLAMASGDVESGKPIMNPNMVSWLSKADTTRKTRAEGILVGGNLARFQGGKLDWLTQKRDEDIILLIEENSEEKRKYDEVLIDLKERGAFERVKAVIIGDVGASHSSEMGVKYSATAIEIITRYMPKDVPIIQVPVGHSYLNMPMPVGTHVVLDLADDRKIYASEPIVQPKSTLALGLK